jgi:hypothetical protein
MSFQDALHALIDGDHQVITNLFNNQPNLQLTDQQGDNFFIALREYGRTDMKDIDEFLDIPELKKHIYANRMKDFPAESIKVFNHVMTTYTRPRKYAKTKEYYEIICLSSKNDEVFQATLSHLEQHLEDNLDEIIKNIYMSNKNIHRLMIFLDTYPHIGRYLQLCHVKMFCYNLEVVEQLINKYHWNINTIGVEGNLLHVSALTENVELFRYLIKNNIDHSMISIRRYNIMDSAISGGHIDIINMCKDMGYSINVIKKWNNIKSEGLKTFIKLLEDGHPVADDILRFGDDLHRTNEVAVHLIDKILELLINRPNVNTKLRKTYESQLLVIGLRYASIEMIKKIIDLYDNDDMFMTCDEVNDYFGNAMFILLDYKEVMKRSDYHLFDRDIDVINYMIKKGFRIKKTDNISWKPHYKALVEIYNQLVE